MQCMHFFTHLTYGIDRLKITQFIRVVSSHLPFLMLKYETSLRAQITHQIRPSMPSNTIHNTKTMIVLTQHRAAVLKEAPSQTVSNFPMLAEMLHYYHPHKNNCVKDNLVSGNNPHLTDDMSIPFLIPFSCFQGGSQTCNCNHQPRTTIHDPSSTSVILSHR